ncbi:MAG: NADAR family protein [Chromatiaceae bacterium]|nr:NADAR family protein [Chromatiaceae bacterium]
MTSKLRSYNRKDVVVFCKTKEAYGGLSNMASGFPINVNSAIIQTSEALYQACRFPHLPYVQQEIIAQTSPMTAKMVGKPFRDNSRPDWLQVRTKIMRWCLRVKLAQNYERFSELLLSTGDLPIVELSRKDEFWGAKISPDSDEILVGQNILGRLLMELREALKVENVDSFKTVAPLNIPNFVLFEKQIEVVVNNIDKSENQWQQNLF